MSCAGRSLLRPAGGHERTRWRTPLEVPTASGRRTTAQGAGGPPPRACCRWSSSPETPSTADSGHHDLLADPAFKAAGSHSSVSVSAGRSALDFSRTRSVPLARAAAILAVIGGSSCSLLPVRAAVGAGWHGGAVRPGQEKQRRIASGQVPKRAGRYRHRGSVRSGVSGQCSFLASKVWQIQCAGRANPSTVEEVTRAPPRRC